MSVPDPTNRPVLCVQRLDEDEHADTKRNGAGEVLRAEAAAAPSHGECTSPARLELKNSRREEGLLTAHPSAHPRTRNAANMKKTA